jgi:2-amino-4-hydroxy-6-hydroxymethyldihydropteridine diphosphokinase
MTSPRRQAFIGIGANVGDRAAAVRGAVAALREAPGVDAVVTSSTYETEPVGMTDQPSFLNLVAGVETTLAPEGLLGRLQEIEHTFGRVRTVRWGPRTLDLDLLAYEGEVRESPGLTLPHPRMLQRAFVTVPLAELLADERFRRPGWDALRADVAAAKPDPAGVRRVLHG